MIQTMKLVKYKYLSVNLKKKKIKEKENKIKEDEIKKNKTSINKSKCISCQNMFYQIKKNEKHAIRNKRDKNWKKTWNNILFGV